jgi:hypothetical protein
VKSTEENFFQLRPRIRSQNSFSKQISWAGTKLAKFNISQHFNVFYINAIVYKLLYNYKQLKLKINFWNVISLDFLQTV